MVVCPFLSEMRVRYCRLAPRRKLIPQTQPAAGELCSSACYAECRAFRESGQQEAAGHPACPCLEDSLMQYCSAAPVPRFVPWSEAAVSRCGNGSHRYCDLFLDIAGPPARGPADEIPVPEHLHFATNHLWLDCSQEVCHIGIDAFLARALGEVDRVDFVTPCGYHRPAVVLAARGVEWQVTFPVRMRVAGCNRYLRSDPRRLIADPYGRGWLFYGTGADPAGLLHGEQAALWMQDEVKRMNEFIQERTGVTADGGVFEAGLLGHLSRADGLLLFNEFVSPG